MTDSTASSSKPDGQDGSSKTHLAVNRIYVKDLSFEVPLGAEAFSRQWQPRVNQDIATEVHQLTEAQYEVVLKVTIAVRQEEQVAYLVELQQAGIFSVTGLNATQLAQVLNTQCPGILFPYARELIDSLVVRGTFPALMLPPVNFEALFQQALAEQANKRADGEPAPATLN